MSGVNAQGEPLDPKESLAYWAVRMSEANPGSPGAALVWAHEEIQRLRQKCATDHHYLSTGCLHDKHKYCQSMTGYQGAKRPASCKFCGAACICPCHRENPSMADTGLVHGLCICDEHRDGASKFIGKHEYRVMTSEAPAAVGGGTAWRWVCSCSPKAIGRWNYQSDSVAYHAWLRHVGVEHR